MDRIDNKHIECDVAVIGASLAGACTAIRLADSLPLASICLIDGQTFPRAKTCGEGLSGRGQILLRSLGIDTAGLPHHRLDGYRICSGLHEAKIPISVPMIDIGTAGIGICRSVLDQALVERALLGPNVRAVVGVQVRNCVEGVDKCELTLADGRTVVCRYVVDASGSRQFATSRTEPRKRLHRYASSQHFSMHESVECNDVHIIVERGFELFVTPVGGSLINVALLAPKDKFAALCRSDGQKHIRSLLERRFAAKLIPASNALNTGPVGNRRRSAAEGKIFFVGDACEQLDPIGGMGMTHALLSGELAAASLTGLLRGEYSLDEARKHYERSRCEAVRPLRGFTRLTLALLRQGGRTPLLPFLEHTSLMRSVSRAAHTSGGSLSLAAALINIVGW